MVALGGGAAGAYAWISPRLSIALVGVAIATALVPPLATCSPFLARADFALAGGALLLAVSNIVAIQFASSVRRYLIETSARHSFGGPARRTRAISAR
jgi:uncharacterized membrane protein